jgi:tetratricopeptide (TPR) repeat protein
MLILRIYDWVSRCQTLKVVSLVLFLSFQSFAQQPQSAYERGIEAFLHNRTAQAAGFFETAANLDQTPPMVHLYLGLVYEELGLYDLAIEQFFLAGELLPEQRIQSLFNVGNVHLRLGDTQQALDYYSRVLASQRNFAPAYLNRANIHISHERLTEALTDYRMFVQFAPEDPATPQVRRMISVIEAELAAREAERIARQAEERQRAIEAQAESERIAREARQEVERQAREAERAAREAERQAQEAENRRRALLDSVFSSLGAASSSAQGAGADTVIEVEEEITIDN